MYSLSLLCVSVCVCIYIYIHIYIYIYTHIYIYFKRRSQRILFNPLLPQQGRFFTTSPTWEAHTHTHTHTRLIPWLGRSFGGGHGNPLQYSCLENPVGRGTWWAAVHRVLYSIYVTYKQDSHNRFFHIYVTYRQDSHRTDFDHAMWYRGKKTVWCYSDWHCIIRADFTEKVTVQLRPSWQEAYSQRKVWDWGKVKGRIPSRRESNSV